VLFTVYVFTVYYCVAACWRNNKKIIKDKSRLALTPVTLMLKVIHLLQAFSNGILCTVVQQLTRFQLTACLYDPSVVAELLCGWCLDPSSVRGNIGDIFWPI